MTPFLQRRYRCDHCRKSSTVRKAILDHETRCLRNPARTCPVCGGAHNLTDLDYRYDGEEIDKMIVGCPNCTLAAIAQSTLTGEDRGYFYDESLAVWRAKRDGDPAALAVAEAALVKRCHEEQAAMNHEEAEAARNEATMVSLAQQRSWRTSEW